MTFAYLELVIHSFVHLFGKTNTHNETHK